MAFQNNPFTLHFVNRKAFIVKKHKLIGPEDLK